MDENISFIVSIDDNGKRLDKLLADRFPDFSRSYIQTLIDDGNVLIVSNKVKKLPKSSHKVKEYDNVTVKIPPPKSLEIMPVDLHIDILYEDDDILVVNKPKGMPVHPGNGHLDDTLVNALLFHRKDSLSGINGVLRPGIVHRIDMDTTGSLIVCKNDNAHKIIAEQIKSHTIFRKYVGIVHGIVKDDERTIKAPIARDKNNRKRMAIVASGKEAITHVKVIKRSDKYTFCQFILETGRTHQIRVHMSSINHPLLGDEVYGSKKYPFSLKGQCLHAQTIGFNLPSTGEYIEIDAPLPDYLKELINESFVGR